MKGIGYHPIERCLHELEKFHEEVPNSEFFLKEILLEYVSCMWDFIVTFPYILTMYLG
jgi:hypothetical protein